MAPHLLVPVFLQNINSNPSRDTGWVFNLVTRAETCFELEVNELKTRGREAPDGLLFYFHNSKDADEQSEVGHPKNIVKRIFWMPTNKVKSAILV